MTGTSDESRDALVERIASSDPAMLLYGMIVGTTGLALAAPHAPSAVLVGAAVLALLVIYWLAHAYVHAVAIRLVETDSHLISNVGSSLARESRLLLGGLPTLAVFVVCSLLGMDISPAALTALWATVGLLGFVGYLAGRRGGAHGWTLIGEIVATASFGLLAVGLKTLLH